MLALIGYPLSIVFLVVAISLGVKGFIHGTHNRHELQTYKTRAIYYSYSILCFLISFEIFYPKLESLICLPVLLISVWMEYLIAASMLKKKND